jgi:hypothetical protein
MEHHPLLDDYTYVFLDSPTFSPLFQQYLPVVFGRSQVVMPESVYNEAEQEAAERLRESFRDVYRLRLGIYHKKETFVGWHVGSHLYGDTFYMTNTGILPEHQNKGIYTRLLQVILPILKEQGFQIVESRHQATNNQVLVPKLKAGFVISGFEISDVFGTLVHLRYFFNPTRRRIMAFRTGELIPDAHLRSLLQLEQTS